MVVAMERLWQSLLSITSLPEGDHRYATSLKKPATTKIQGALRSTIDAVAEPIQSPDDEPLLPAAYAISVTNDASDAAQETVAVQQHLQRLSRTWHADTSALASVLPLSFSFLSPTASFFHDDDVSET